MAAMAALTVSHHAIISGRCIPVVRDPLKLWLVVILEESKLDECTTSVHVAPVIHPRYMR